MGLGILGLRHVDEGSGGTPFFFLFLMAFLAAGPAGLAWEGAMGRGGSAPCPLMDLSLWAV
eukprot:11944764-Alexandrium_andersonii.AAC.1